MKVRDLFEKINNPKDNEYGKLLILFQVMPVARFRGKFLPINDSEVMYGTNNYELFESALKKSVNAYVYDLIINKEMDDEGLNCWPIFDDEVRKEKGQGEGKGYIFNIYLYPANEFDYYKDIYLHRYHKRFDEK